MSVSQSAFGVLLTMERTAARRVARLSHKRAFPFSPFFIAKSRNISARLTERSAVSGHAHCLDPIMVQTTFAAPVHPFGLGLLNALALSILNEAALHLSHHS